MIEIVEARPPEDFRLWVRFTDGVEGVVDLSDFAGRGVFRLWDDPAAFADLSVGASGEVIWSDQVDIGPETIYLRVTGKQLSDVFSKLRELKEQPEISRFFGNVLFVQM